MKCQIMLPASSFSSCVTVVVLTLVVAGLVLNSAMDPGQNSYFVVVVGVAFLFLFLLVALVLFVSFSD